MGIIPNILWVTKISTIWINSICKLKKSKKAPKDSLLNLRFWKNIHPKASSEGTIPAKVQINPWILPSLMYSTPRRWKRSRDLIDLLMKLYVKKSLNSTLLDLKEKSHLSLYLKETSLKGTHYIYLKHPGHQIINLKWVSLIKTSLILVELDNHSCRSRILRKLMCKAINLWIRKGRKLN